MSTFSGGSISINADGLKDIGIYGNKTSGALNITDSAKNYNNFYDNETWYRKINFNKYFFNKD